MLYSKQKQLVSMVADQMYESEKSNTLMVSILSHIVEFRNGESGLHVLHIGTMTEMLLKRLREKTDAYNLDAAKISMISKAAAFHDIGKISISEEIISHLLGYPKEELCKQANHNALELVCEADRVQVERALRKAMEKGSELNAYFRVNHVQHYLKWC